MSGLVSATGAVVTEKLLVSITFPFTLGGLRSLSPEVTLLTGNLCHLSYCSRPASFPSTSRAALLTGHRFFSIPGVCFGRRPLSPYLWSATRTLFLTPGSPFMTGNRSELFMTGTLASNTWTIIFEVVFSFSVTSVIIYDFKPYCSVHWVLVFVGTGQRRVFSCTRISEKRLLLLHLRH